MPSMVGAQPWDQLRFAADLGPANTGLTVVLTIVRLNDGEYWTGSAYQVGATTVSGDMNEVDATNYPGLYEYDMPAGGNDVVLSNDGFRYKMDEGTVPFDESGNVHIWTPDRVIKAPVVSSVAVGNFADFVQRINGARHHNSRIINLTWNTAGRPTTGLVLVYDTASDLNADSGPSWALAVGRYDFALTYDGSGRLTEYTSVLTT